MQKPFSGNILWAISAFWLVLAFVYILVVIRPELIFHHTQAPFLTGPLFYKQYLNYPGGLSELTANLVLQTFHFRLFGSLIILLFLFSIAYLTHYLCNSIFKSKINLIWAAISAWVTVLLMNNYNFPFSTVVSFTTVLIFLAVLTRFGKNLFGSIVLFILGGIFIYGFSGSGTMSLYAVAALFVFNPLKKWFRVILLFFIVTFGILFPILVSEYLFPVSLNHKYLYFFSTKAWFMKYYPSPVFAFYLLSIPVILLFSNLVLSFNTRFKKVDEAQKRINIKIGLAFFVVVTFVFYGHKLTYNSDAKKIVKADYYSYKENPEKTEKYATTTRDYNFASNVNYNLVLAKKNRLTEEFFSFMQIKGFESLHPDIDFATELSFVSTEYYYELGFISEARHWAYETLVFYPYSIRAMQNLVKIHLVLGEYKAAERTLNTLNKGFLNKKFVHEFMPYVLDTNLILSNSELMEKRSFIPKEKELNRSIEGRLKELLEANKNNKLAYECLMLYYLTNAQLENFTTLLKDVNLYFDKMPVVYEEALLMHAHRTENEYTIETKISKETQERFNGFINELEKYKGQTRMARNQLYAEYGKSYLYFLKFVYPNILETEIISDEEDYPEI